MDHRPGRKRKREQDNVPSSAATSTQPAEGAAAARDMMLIQGVSEDGEKLAVLRAREDRVEAGVVSKVKEGEPLHGELLSLTPRPEFPLLCDVKVELPGPAARIGKQPDDRIATGQRLSHGGPAQVATDSYRANWDAIWSKKKSSQLN